MYVKRVVVREKGILAFEEGSKQEKNESANLTKIFRVCENDKVVGSSDLRKNAAFRSTGDQLKTTSGSSIQPKQAAQSRRGVKIDLSNSISKAKSSRSISPSHIVTKLLEDPMTTSLKNLTVRRHPVL